MQLSVYSKNKINSRRAMLILVIMAVTAALFTGCGGGGGSSGGGGGGGGATVTVTGTVLDAQTYAPPTSAAMLVIGGATITTNAATGTFTGTVGSNATTAVVSAPGEISRTIPITLVASQVNNLGNIFLAATGSGYTASVNGVVVTTVKGVTTPVGGATVNIGNVVGVSATNGTFTLNGLPVGLGSVDGLYGTVTAKGFAVKLITADVLQFALVTGSNNIGNLLLGVPVGSTPVPPYTITGVVDVAGVPGSGVTVAISVQGGSQLAQTTTDANGNYYFWVAPATYAIAASDTTGGAPVGENVTVVNLTTPVTAPTLNLSQ
jgi:hypothetical protein